MGSSAGRVPAFLPHYRTAYLLLDSKPQRKESASGVFEQRGVSYGQDRGREGLSEVHNASCNVHIVGVMDSRSDLVEGVNATK